MHRLAIIYMQLDIAIASTVKEKGIIGKTGKTAKHIRSERFRIIANMTNVRDMSRKGRNTIISISK